VRLAGFLSYSTRENEEQVPRFKMRNKPLNSFKNSLGNLSSAAELPMTISLCKTIPMRLDGLHCFQDSKRILSVSPWKFSRSLYIPEQSYFILHNQGIVATAP